MHILNLPLRHRYHVAAWLCMAGILLILGEHVVHVNYFQLEPWWPASLTLPIIVIDAIMLFGVLLLPVLFSVTNDPTNENSFESLNAAHQAKLQAIEARQNAIFDASPDAQLISDSRGTITHANRQIERLLGYTASELIGQPIEVLMPQRLRGKHPSQRAEFAENPKARQMGQGREVMAQRKDGSEFAVEIRLSRIETPSGCVFVSALRDVSERKHFEEQLLRQNATLASIIQNLPSGISVFGPDLHLVAHNQLFVDMMEFPESLLAKPRVQFEDFIRYNAERGEYGPGDQEELVQTIVNRARTFEAHTLERTRPNGTALEIRGMPLPDGGFVSVYVDISDRQRAEKFEQFRSHTLELLAGGQPLNGVLQAICLGVEKVNPRMRCSVLLLDNEGLHLGKGVAPSLPDFYNSALEGIAIGIGVGSCGTAAFTGERVIVEDIASHPYWQPYKELASQAGLGACWSQPVRSSAGRVLGTFAIYHDQAQAPSAADIAIIDQSAHLASIAIERRQADDQLRIAAAAFESQESMIVTDVNGIILRVNHAFTKSTGYSAQEAVGQTPRLTKSDRHDAGFFREMWASIQRTGGWQGEIWDRRKNGEVYPKWLTISAVKGDAGAVTHYIGTHYDITERKKAQEKISELAFFDQLTRLPNRTLLLDRLKQAMTVSERMGMYGAVLFIDLDNFKSLNDTLGHDVGDMLLQQVAQRLTACVRDGDTVARLGGDEFVVVLTSLGASEVDAGTGTKIVARKILASLNQTHQLGGTAHHSTASIGATLFLGQTASADDLMKQADLAMYRTKEGGRNALRFFDPEMEAAVLQRVGLEKDLREAVAQNQFLLYYQAQVQDSNGLIGAEVLLRWRHPQRGMVSPADFIPLAEETGLILPLGLWVLETACSQLALWALNPDMSHLTIAVNVSARQFHQSDFVEQVVAVLESTGANPRRLKLELTESLLVTNVEETIGKMIALRVRGVSFSLDDFGTGYSSLAYLKRLPLDQLKIDQSFVRDILIDPNDAAIARTIVALASSLGLGVIAEGVETQAQRDFLANHGCHAYQGYLFSHPLPLPGFETLAQQYARRDLTVV